MALATSIQSPLISNQAEGFHRSWLGTIAPPPAKTTQALASRVLVSRTLDLLITTRLVPKQGTLAHLRRMLDARARKRDRLVSMISLGDAVIPGVTSYLSSVLCNTRNIPLNAVSTELIGYGSGTTVFLIRTPGSSIVLKVVRRSLGKQLRDLITLAREFRGKHDIVSSLYGNDSGIILPAQFLVLRSPVAQTCAAAIIQPYMGSNTKDLFKDFSDQELVSLLHCHDHFRMQFVHFCEKTISLYSERNQVLDLIGSKNVMLVNHKHDPGIVVIDYGMFDVAATAHRYPKVHLQLKDIIDRMKSILQTIS